VSRSSLVRSVVSSSLESYTRLSSSLSDSISASVDTMSAKEHLADDGTIPANSEISGGQTSCLGASPFAHGPSQCRQGPCQSSATTSRRDSVEGDFTLRSRLAPLDDPGDKDSTFTISSNDSPFELLKSVPRHVTMMKTDRMPSRHDSRPMVYVDDVAHGDNSPTVAPALAGTGQQVYSPSYVPGRISFACMLSFSRLLSHRLIV